MKSFQNIFDGKKVLITGHTGFKGSWLSMWLFNLGAKITGISLDIPTQPSNFEASELGTILDDHRVDIRDSKRIDRILEDSNPDFVFHLAAQSIVRYSYENPLETISINALGTATLLDGLRKLKKNIVAVIITSDKAYDNVEWVWGYRETDSLGGKDPYSASKGMAELAIRAYFESYFKSPDSNVRIGIARAGNVIGGGDWAENRIVPDCMKAWSCGDEVSIRNPNSTRPWQHVLEPIGGYLVLGAKLALQPEVHGQSFNFGPPAEQNYSVDDLISEMGKYWDNARWKKDSIESRPLHEAGLLKLNCDKALFDLNWKPTMDFGDTVRMTVEWYREFYEGNRISMRKFTIAQINEYTQLAQSKNMSWTIL
ncbi:MAG: CDP-glucose 4,6-dehydratase [Nitrosomonadaceae bacterium]|nr:CDP-glucose 4,6-dehydratase [Nitrosomonadaceae bacterium]|tara:strand:- start:509 stop:1615 length:1107 start_codon:yes stop_codon:yes gene_type:complete